MGAQAAVHRPPRTQDDNIVSINPSARKKTPRPGLRRGRLVKAARCDIQPKPIRV